MSDFLFNQIRNCFFVILASLYFLLSSPVFRYHKEWTYLLLIFRRSSKFMRLRSFLGIRQDSFYFERSIDKRKYSWTYSSFDIPNNNKKRKKEMSKKIKRSAV